MGEIIGAVTYFLNAKSFLSESRKAIKYVFFYWGKQTGIKIYHQFVFSHGQQTALERFSVVLHTVANHLKGYPSPVSNLTANDLSV